MRRSTMDDPNPITLSSSMITSAFIPFLIVLIFLYNRRNKTSTRQLPPGDLGLPWIGETVEFFRASKSNRLYEDFIGPRVRKHGSPTFKTRLLGSPTVVVCGERANRFFLSNEFKLVVSSWPASSVDLMGRSSIMEKQGHPHRLTRAIVTSCFNPSGMDTLTPAISRVVISHLRAHWTPEAGKKLTLSLFRSAKMVAFRVVCECLLEMEAKEEMLGMFERVLEGVFAAKVEVPGTSFWKAKRARREIERVVVESVRRKRLEMRESGEETLLMGRLVAAMLRGEMTEEEVVDNVVLFVFAAIDTTSFAMAMTFKMLALHPDCSSLVLQEHEKIIKRREGKGEGGGGELSMEEVKEMKYTWQVARETLRLHPPIFGSFRKALTDIHFDGFFIPKGWKVLWTTYGTHKSEEYFKKAEEFDPRRFEETMAPYVYVPFGGGPRLCAGYPLSKLNILIFVHYVVTQYDWSLLLPHEPISVNPLPFPSLGMPISLSPKPSAPATTF